MSLRYLFALSIMFWVVAAAPRAHAQCEIRDVTPMPLACDPADSTYDLQVFVAYTGLPSASVLINGQPFDTTDLTGTDTFTLTDLPALGGQTTVEVSASADADCARDIDYDIPPPCLCTIDAGDVWIDLNGTRADARSVCVGDDVDDIVTLTHTEIDDNATFSYVITRFYGATVERATSDPVLDLDALTPGFYRIWGLAVPASSTSEVVPGAPLTEGGVVGACFDLSRQAVYVEVVAADDPRCERPPVFVPAKLAVNGRGDGYAAFATTPFGGLRSSECGGGFLDANQTTPKDGGAAEFDPYDAALTAPRAPGGLTCSNEVLFLDRSTRSAATNVAGDGLFNPPLLDGTRAALRMPSSFLHQDHLVGLDGAIRHTVYSVPEFPNLVVELDQRAACAALTQVYRFRNIGDRELAFRIYHYSDTDLGFGSSFTHNRGIHDYVDDRNAGVVNQALDVGARGYVEPDPRIRYEGWRAINQRSGAWDASKRAVMYYGMPNPDYQIRDDEPGVDEPASLLGGIFKSGVFNNAHAQYITPDGGTLPERDADPGRTGVSDVESDAGFGFQAWIVLEPGESRTWRYRYEGFPASCALRAVAGPDDIRQVDISHNCAAHFVLDGSASFVTGTDTPSFTWYDAEGEVLSTEPRFELDVIAPFQGLVTLEVCNHVGDCDRDRKEIRVDTPAGQCRCGDGWLKVGETCDDGNSLDADGCSASCQREDGWECASTVPLTPIYEPGGQCWPTCGDQLVVGDEGCDDGNVDVGDGCAECQVEPGWRCDAPGGCVTICGDGLVAGGEACDDGGAAVGDGCEACVIQAGWECVGAPSSCEPTCGDGLVVGAEACDDGNRWAGDGCSPLCAEEPGWICPAGAACHTVCGDGVVAGEERCDDGGGDSADGCDASCEVEAGWRCAGAPSVCDEICGDGLLTGAEGCDDGALTQGDGCSASCELEPGWVCPLAGAACQAICGDGLVVGVEGCDDGGVSSGDGCDSRCQVELGWRCDEGADCAAVCGDGLLRGAEACDDGGTEGGDGCSASCEVEAGWRCLGAGACSPICGDGVRVGDEGCDDGDLLSGDGCDGACRVEPGWSCADASSPCTSACGDGARAGNEACDDGNSAAGDGCSPACTVEVGWRCDLDGCHTVCGDGVTAGAEACDDGGLASGDGCDAACEVEAGWACAPSQACAPVCGDGLVVAAEHCDDGGVEGGDGCSATCQVEAGWACAEGGAPCVTVCGDGLVRGAEVCDDGNVASGDGCPADCLAVEPGWRCAAVGDPCVPLCGDGVVVADERCDDGNLEPGDGCDAQCVPELGYSCSAAGCEATCGDGVIVGGEQCDDGGVVDGDGCSSLCEVEPEQLCAGEPSVCRSIDERYASGGSCAAGGGPSGLAWVFAALLLIAAWRRRRGVDLLGGGA